MIKQKRLLSLILLLTILLSGLITTGVYAEQENVGNSFKEWDEVHLVDDMKKWTITFNQEINSSTVNDNNIYVKNHLGERVEDTRVIKGADERTIILQPPRNGYSSEYDYTLHIENILSKQDKKLKDNIVMKFFIEDNTVKDEVEYQDDVVKLREVTTSFDNEDYREIIVPLTEFKAKGLDKGSIIIIDPTEKDIYGYAGKIDSYQVEGENVVIRTTEPLFEELFTHLDLKGKQEVSVEQMLNAQLKEGIEAKPYREYDLQTKRYTQGVEYIFGAKDGSIADVGIKYGDFIIKGSIKVENPDIDYDIKTSWGLFSGFKLDSFYLAYTADIVSDLEIEYRKSFSGNLDEKITLFKYPVPLGATGLIVDLSLDVYADGDVRSSGKVEAKLSQKTKITLGARQTRNGNMEWVRNTTKEEPEFISTIETEFKANAEAGISPTMELSFYKIASAGLVGKIGPYLKLDAKAKGKGDYTDGYFDGKLYAEAGVAFSSDMYLGAAFGLIAKDYSLGRTEIKIWSYTEEYNAETQGELQSIKFPENIINMETGDSKKLRIIGVYKNRVTENIFEAPIDSGVEYILNPSNSASIDNAGNIKILTDENREIEVTARYKGKEGKMVVYVEEQINFAEYSNMICSSGFSTIALKKDGTVWAWGATSLGSIHEGGEAWIKEFGNVPIQIKGINDVVNISAGGGQFMALKKDGTVWAWGGNSWGELGDGTNNDSNTPVQVKGLNDVVDISAGGGHSVALKKDGTVWAWGYNGAGQLGNGTVSSDWEGLYNNSNVPVQVKGLNDVIAISANMIRTVALKNDGTVWAWGSNWLVGGDGALDKASSVPIQVEGLKNVIAISAGGSHTEVLKNNGTVWTWGLIYLGYEHAYNNVPVQTKGLKDVIAISNGTALKKDGTVWIYYGVDLPGDGINYAPNNSIQVKGLKDVVAISGAAALKRDGTVWTWGDNYWGQLGDGTYEDSNIPVQTLIKLW